SRKGGGKTPAGRRRREGDGGSSLARGTRPPRLSSRTPSTKHHCLSRRSQIGREPGRRGARGGRLGKAPVPPGDPAARLRIGAPRAVAHRMDRAAGGPASPSGGGGTGRGGRAIAGPTR